MEEQDKLLKRISDLVLDMDEEGIVDAVREYLDAGFDPEVAVLDGLVDGMNRAGELFAEEEYYVTDLLFCADTFELGMEILQPILMERVDTRADLPKVVIGTVEGDTHDIGKNLCHIMLEAGGFEVIDLGKDVPLQNFIDEAVAQDAHLIGLSALMTTTMGGMRRVIELLEEQGLRQQIKVMIGGSPVTQAFCDEIGADGYSENAFECVELAKRLTHHTEMESK